MREWLRLPGLLVCIMLLQVAYAESATLLRAQIYGQDIKIELDRNRGLAILAFEEGARFHLNWLETGELTIASSDVASEVYWQGFVPADDRPDLHVPGWEPAMSIAGHATFYHPVFMNDRLCGESLVNHWMKPFAETLLTAIDVAMLIAEHRLAGGAPVICAKARPSAFASEGLPLLIASHDRKLFETMELRFDHALSEEQIKNASERTGKVTGDWATFLAQN